MSAGQPSRKVTPAPDPEQMAADALVTSIVAGVSLVIATVLLGIAGGLGIELAKALSASRSVTMVLVALGLAGGSLLIGTQLRSNAPRLLRRGKPWYRGAWIGFILALSIMVLMYYFPWIVIPSYCPPGAPCEATG